MNNALSWQGEAEVVAALYSRDGGTLALAFGDGLLRLVTLADGTIRDVPAHEDGAILSAVVDGDGFLTGGDDGRMVHVTAGGEAIALASFTGKWVGAVAAHPGEGLRAAAVGKEVHLFDAKGVRAVLAHPATVDGIAFNPRGKRLAAAHYDGVSLWWTAAPAKNQTQTPKKLAWKGSHRMVSWSPDGEYVLTATQENDLHGWRVADGKDMRMRGYPTKVRSLAWTAKPPYVVTSGAEAVTCWPFAGSGPMGKSPMQIAGARDDRLVTQVASHAAEPVVAAGFADGSIILCDLRDKRTVLAREAVEAADTRISALAFAPDGRSIAWGAESGACGLLRAG
jgi:WD40 repeat protein